MTATPGRLRQLAGVFCGLWVVVAAGSAQQAPPGQDLFGSLSWRSIGSYRGGRVTAVAGVRDQPLVYYQGPTGGGVWKTEDGGLTWRPISDGFFQTGTIGAIAVADSNSNVIYVGTGEACFRNNSAEGDGVYKSTDAGRTWTHVGLEETKQIGRIRIDPKNPERVFVAALGNVFGPSAERGVFRSRNGGRTWERVLFVNDVTGAADIAMDPVNPDVLYAGFWHVRHKPWGHFSGGPGSGLYKSTDGGDTWKPVTSGLPAGMKGRVGVTVSPVNPNRVWTIVEAEDGGLFRSDDAGISWTKVNDEAKVRDRPWYYSHIYADTKDLDTVYVLTLQLHKSVDGGKTFQAVRGSHGDHHDLWIAPEDNQRLINGNDGGATVTMDGGGTWTTEENQATAQFYHVSTDNQFPYRVYGAQQDNSTISIASRTPSGGIERTDWYPVGGGESGHVAPDPQDPNIVYAGTYYGQLTRYDHRTREVRNISVWPESPGGHPAADAKYRFQWTFPIVFSPFAPKTLYAAANVLFKSTNEGRSWEAISPDLTRNDKSTEGPSGGPLTGDNSSAHYYATIFVVAPSRRSRDTIWVGSDDGLVHVTTDGGKTWQNITPKDVLPFTRVSGIEPSPHDAATAYLAVNRYQLDDRRPYIYGTTDYGKSWTLLSTGIPDGAFVRVVREDPRRRGLLYAGTETGVFVSFDGGGRWQSLQRNLPRVPITDLAVKDDDLVAATQGRAFWILDDLSPLQQMVPEVTLSDAFLFKPRATYRFRSGGTAGPAIGQNPPGGVVVHYYLREAPKEPVTLEFCDQAGTTIKRYRSEAQAAPVAPNAFEEVGRGGGGRRTLPARAGMNRFEWDMRYPDAVGPPEGVLLFGASLRGPVAVPGNYTVKLTVGGRTMGAPFEIKPDPRITTTDAEFRQQFDLLIRIRDAVTASHEAVNTIIKARVDLANLVQRASDRQRNRDVAQKARLLADQLAVIQDELIQMKIRYGNDVLTYPVKLDNKLAALTPVVASADTAPTAQAQEVFAQLLSRLGEQVTKLERVLKTDLPALNALAAKRGLQATSNKTAGVK